MAKPHKEAAREFRNKRKRLGKCIDCFKPVAKHWDGRNKLRCEECLGDRAAKQNEYRERLKNGIRREINQTSSINDNRGESSIL